MASSLAPLGNRIIIEPYQEPLYDRDVPDKLLCPISQSIMEEPVTVDCGQAHCFERKAIEGWMRNNPTCPQDRNPISKLQPNRDRIETVALWKKNHFVLEIQPEQLAQYILDPERIPAAPGEQRNVKFGAYLRYVTSVHKIQEVVARVLDLVKGKEADLPDVRHKERPKNFQNGAWKILKKILSDVRKELDGPSSPRTSRMIDFMRSSQTSVRDSLSLSQAQHRALFESMQARLSESQAETVAMRAENGAMRARIDDLIHRQDEAEAQRRAEEQARSRGPSKLEVGQAILGVVSGVTATALGRGFGGVMDADPSTTFFSEASSVDKMDLLGAGLQAARVLWAYKKSDGHLVRRLNERFSESVFASVAAGSASYYSTIASTQRRIEKATDKSEIQSLKTEVTRAVNDSIAKQNSIDSVTEVANKLVQKVDADAARIAQLAQKADDDAALVAQLVQKVDDANKLAQKAADDAAQANKAWYLKMFGY